ncbi:unnamed protein product [Urochloa humidicola]
MKFGRHLLMLSFRDQKLGRIFLLMLQCHKRDKVMDFDAPTTRMVSEHKAAQPHRLEAWRQQQHSDARRRHMGSPARNTEFMLTHYYG